MKSFLTHDGVKLNVHRGASGTPVYFQHGLCGSAAQTQEAFPDDPRFQLVTMECRGHGVSEAGDEKCFTIRAFADDLAALMQEKKTVVGGISMGAAIALHMAVHRPELVKALVLARPAWLLDAAPENGRPNVEVGELLQGLPPNIAKEKFLASNIAKHLAETAPDNLQSLTSFFARERIATTSALLRRIASDGPGVTEQQVRALTIPTLIIATEQDHIHPLSHAQALHAMIPQARLAVIAPKGQDKPRYVSEFRATLLKFLEETA
jgi:pimeloyl-ACP methyl ester carboxylesterase